MKRAVIGIAMSWLIAGGVAGLLRAADDTDSSPVAPPPEINDSIREITPAEPETAPASMAELKAKLEALNAKPATSGLEEVIKMYQAGVDKSVIETYIQHSRLPAPSPKEIIYLHEQGVPQEIVTALINHGGKQGSAVPSGGSSSTEAAGGATYNNYVYNAGSGTGTPNYIPDSTSTETSSANNNNLLIIPYNPYPSYNQSSYSSPFYSYPSSWYYNWYPPGPSYSFYYGPPFGPRHFAAWHHFGHRWPPGPPPGGGFRGGFWR